MFLPRPIATGIFKEYSTRRPLAQRRNVFFPVVSSIQWEILTEAQEATNNNADKNKTM
jgi:hypothetical protein